MKTIKGDDELIFWFFQKVLITIKTLNIKSLKFHFSVVLNLSTILPANDLFTIQKHHDLREGISGTGIVNYIYE